MSQILRQTLLALGLFSTLAIPAISHAEPLSLASAATPDSNFPSSVRVQIKTETGLDLEQWNNILKVVNKPEQDNLRWQDFYGYCENIGDDRGYTIGFFGATTGGPNDTGPDAPAVFREYGNLRGWGELSLPNVLAQMGIKGTTSGKILKIQSSAKTFCGKIRALNGDATWQTAMWHQFLKSYVKAAVSEGNKRGFHSAVVIGAMTDAALNQGIEGRYGLQGILANINGKYNGEADFLKKFSAERSKEVDKHEFNQPPNGTNRVKQWTKLWDRGDASLKAADAAVLDATNWQMK